MRTVNCVKLGIEAEGLAFAPWPGELGKRIYQNVSKQAWADWMAHRLRATSFRKADCVRNRRSGLARGCVHRLEVKRTDLVDAAFVITHDDRIKPPADNVCA